MYQISRVHNWIYLMALMKAPLCMNLSARTLCDAAAASCIVWHFACEILVTIQHRWWHERWQQNKAVLKSAFQLLDAWLSLHALHALLEHIKNWDAGDSAKRLYVSWWQTVLNRWMQISNVDAFLNIPKLSQQLHHALCDIFAREILITIQHRWWHERWQQNKAVHLALGAV